MTSLGFENTIQPPFSQKNFIMAVQKIVSDRKEENEKRLRRLNHHQRKSTPMSAKQEFVNHEDFYQEGQPNSSSRQTEHFVQPGFTPSHQHHQGSAEGPHLQLVHTEAEAEQELLAGLAEEGLEGLDDLIHEEQVEQFMDQLEEDSLEGDNIEGFEEETLDYSQFQSEFQASAESQGKESHTEQLIPLPHELINEPIPHLNSNPHHSNTAQYYETSFTQKDWVLMLGGIGIGLIMCFYFLSQVFLSALLQ